MARLIKRNKQTGFTLVELLIVVAIIGVLATVGVPTFKKMIQKSKKAEAKVALGGLFTAEQAFYGEHSVYGNNIRAMGYELEGQSLIYVVGFAAADCKGPGTVLPSGTATLGGKVKTAFPSYFTDQTDKWKVTAADTVTNLAGGVVGNTALTACAVVTADGKTALGVTQGVADVYSDTGESNRFVATANGVISPSVTVTGSITLNDVWGITEKRVLANYIDGVK